MSQLQHMLWSCMWSCMYLGAQLQHMLWSMHVELHVPGGSTSRPVSLAPWLEHLPTQQLTQLVLKPLARQDPGEQCVMMPFLGMRHC